MFLRPCGSAGLSVLAVIALPSLDSVVVAVVVGGFVPPPHAIANHIPAQNLMGCMRKP
jgi:hypothetical protein